MSVGVAMPSITAAARAEIERHHVRWSRLDAKFDRQYHKALHDTHGRNNYLWCSYCRAAK
jgi:hypothetical protein